jgi:hypothetical protein
MFTGRNVDGQSFLILQKAKPVDSFYQGVVKYFPGRRGDV